MPAISHAPTGAVAEQLPGVIVSFQSPPPYSRFNVLVSSPVGQAVSEEFASALVAIGFNQRRVHPASKGRLSQTFERQGSGLCGGWSAAERDKLTRDARLTLRRFGFTMVPEVRS
jgi:hypothetical protein